MKMANIAQMINVLQAMILTDKEKMLLTPTYHVFEMYSVHQDAKLLPCDLQSSDYVSGAEKIPAVHISASRAQDGKIHVSLCQLDPNAPAEITCELPGAKARKLSGRILTASDITAHNSFEQPEALKPADFDAFKTTANGFNATLPVKSVVVLEIE